MELVKGGFLDFPGSLILRTVGKEHPKLLDHYNSWGSSGFSKCSIDTISVGIHSNSVKHSKDHHPISQLRKQAQRSEGLHATSYCWRVVGGLCATLYVLLLERSTPSCCPLAA